MADEVARPDEGGESACFAHLTCPECGAVLDGSGHLAQCHSAPHESGTASTEGTSTESA